MSAAGLLLSTLVVPSNGIARMGRIRNSVNIDVHRRSQEQSIVIPPSPLLTNSVASKKRSEKGILSENSCLRS